MRIAGHSYDNDVFKSLKNILEENIDKKADNTTNKITKALDLSFVTQNDFDNIQQEKLSDVAAELSFAASRLGIEINKDDLKQFTKKSSDLRGKNLERAAIKFCHSIDKDRNGPQGTKSVVDAQDSFHQHSVAAATVAPGDNVEQGNQGYLGMSKNPNTIWDADALRRKSQVKSNDEKTAEEKQKELNFKLQQKEAHWKQQAEGGDVISKGILPSGNAEKAATGRKFPANSMSMFSDDRDFSDIPEKTAGEKIKDKQIDEKEISEIQGSKKADNTGSSFFNNSHADIQRSNIHRSSIDKIFDALNK